jgi:hypothetical protein
MQTQRICRAWGQSFARGFALVILDRLRVNPWIRRPALAIEGASWTLALCSTSSTRPQLEEALLNGLYPETPPFPRAFYPIKLVRSCGILKKKEDLNWRNWGASLMLTPS